MKVSIGTQFRSTYADGNPLWEVKRKLGPSVWEAVVMPDPVVIDGKTFEGDWEGTTKAFRSADILASLKMAQFWKHSGDDSERWYASLKVGLFVHQKNFRGFVRCKVVLDAEGKKAVLPIALVGEWGKSELPHRDVTGDIYLPYHAKQIADKEVFHAHASHFWEYRNDKGDLDPRQLPPISLEVQLMTAEESARATLWQQVYRVRKVLETETKNPQEILNAVRRLI